MPAAAVGSRLARPQVRRGPRPIRRVLLISGGNERPCYNSWNEGSRRCSNTPAPGTTSWRLAMQSDSTPSPRTEKACTRCGVVKPLADYQADRRASDGRTSSCRACEKARCAARHAANREADNAQSRERYAANPEAARAQRRAYAAAHREERREYRRRYYAENRDALIAKVTKWVAENHDRRRRYIEENADLFRDHHALARARRAGVEIGPRFTRQQIWDRDGGCCHICGEPCDPDDWHPDHIIPLSKGGPHTFENVAVSHPVCNRRKNNRIIGDRTEGHG